MFRYTRQNAVEYIKSVEHILNYFARMIAVRCRNVKTSRKRFKDDVFEARFRVQLLDWGGEEQQEHRLERDRM